MHPGRDVRTDRVPGVALPPASGESPPRDLLERDGLQLLRGRTEWDRLEAAMRLLLSVEPDAFVWTLRAPMPRRLREAFAFHPVGSRRNGYRIPLMVRRPAPAHP
jgi:hypothetical protein